METYIQLLQESRIAFIIDKRTNNNYDSYVSLGIPSNKASTMALLPQI